MSDQFLSESLVSYIEKCVLDKISNDIIVKIFQILDLVMNNCKNFIYLFILLIGPNQLLVFFLLFYFCISVSFI